MSVLLRVLPDDARGSVLHTTTSGAVLGDWTNSVTYAAVAFQLEERPPLSEEERALLLRLVHLLLHLFGLGHFQADGSYGLWGHGHTLSTAKGWGL